MMIAITDREPVIGDAPLACVTRRVRRSGHGVGPAQRHGERMRRMIAVAQRKGGVGKTTLGVSLAAEAKKRGRDVALIDADSQNSACRWAELGNLEYPVY